MPRKAASFALVAGLTMLATHSPAFGQGTVRQPGTTVAYEAEIIATVESVDQKTREIVLRGPNGGTIAVFAGPAVENLSKVKAGDRLRVRYTEALAASVAKPGQGRGGTITEQTGISRGETQTGNPTATVGSQVRSTVTIQGIDRATHAVTFAGPDNIARTVVMRDPNARRFVSKLKVGDKVNMVYTESVAVDLEPQS